MKTFEYTGYDLQGRQKRGLVEAWNPKEARERLSREGILARELTVAGHGARFPLEARVAFYREMGALLSAGLPLMRAFDLLLKSPELGSARVLVAGVRDRAREGVALSAALQDAGGSVSGYEHAVLVAAERSGAMDRVLVDLAGFLEAQERLRQRVQAALTYPLIVFTLGICVALVMLGVLLPRTQAILVSVHTVELPWVTRAFLAMGSLLRAWGLPVLVLLAASVAAWLAGVRRSDALRRSAHRWWLGAPVAGRGLVVLANLRFSRTLAMLLDGGVGLIEGVRLAGQATGNAWIQSRIEMAADELVHGARLSEVLERIPPLAGLLAGYAGVGEATGDLKRLLQEAADRYESRWELFVTRSLGVLEPILIVSIGAFVLLVALAVLLPILSMSQVLGR